MHACSLWRPQMMDMSVKSSVSCSWFLYPRVTTVSHLDALGLYKTEVVALQSMGWPFSLVYAVTVRWAAGSGISPPSSAWHSLSLGSRTGVVCMYLWLGGLSDSWFLLGALWTARTESGVEIEWGSLVLSSLGHAIWSQILLWGQAFLKGAHPRGPSLLLTPGNHSFKSPVPEVTWAIGPRAQDSIVFHEAFRLCCYNGSILNFYQSIQ